MGLSPPVARAPTYICQHSDSWEESGVFENWSPSERRGFGTAFGTVCLACLAWAFPNMSRIVTIPGAIIAFGLTVYFLVPEIEYAASRITNPKGEIRFGVVVAAIISVCLMLGWDG
jgi:hypothetical protein